MRPSAILTDHAPTVTADSRRRDGVAKTVIEGGLASPMFTPSSRRPSPPTTRLTLTNSPSNSAMNATTSFNSARTGPATCGNGGGDKSLVVAVFALHLQLCGWAARGRRLRRRGVVVGGVGPLFCGGVKKAGGAPRGRPAGGRRLARRIRWR